MTKQTLIALMLAGGLLAATAAHADHNSVWGAGSASMPNDIHNSAIEDDQDVFLDLVQQGGGADSVNRYDDDSTDTSMGSDTSGGSSVTTSTSRMGSQTVATRGSQSVTRGGSRR